MTAAEVEEQRTQVRIFQLNEAEEAHVGSVEHADQLLPLRTFWPHIDIFVLVVNV